MILVVEDTPVFRKFVCTLLGDALSVPVQEAASGEAALSLTSPQTVVITDLQMPGMGGLELIRSIRAEASYQDVPIVAMSADPDARSGAAALGAGANAFFAKPFDPEKFVDTVSSLMAPASAPGP